MRDDGCMWRHLLEYTDSIGRATVGVAVALLVVAVGSFILGIVQATTGHAAATLPSASSPTTRPSARTT
jgi:hypothetical protein